MPLNYMETGSLLLSKVSVNRLYFFDRLKQGRVKTLPYGMECEITNYPPERSAKVCSCFHVLFVTCNCSLSRPSGSFSPPWDRD